MRRLKSTILILTTLLMSASVFAQTDIFVRQSVIAAPKIENGGLGNIIAGVDFDGDGKKEIYFVNDQWYSSPIEGHQLIPTIYKYEFNGLIWDSVWSAELDIDAQNSWPTLHYGDWDNDGKMEIIWSPINNFSGSNDNPSRVVVFESAGDGSDAMGVLSGGKYIPNAQWTIVADTSHKQEMRPFASAFTDIDGDGTDEYIFTDRKGFLNFGVVSVDNIPDNADGSEHWTLEVSGRDSLNVVGPDTMATFMGAGSYKDLAVVGNKIFIFDTNGDIVRVQYNGGKWSYLPVQRGKLPPWHVMKTAQVVDLDGDSKEEILIANYYWSGDKGQVFLVQEDADSVVTTQIADLKSVGQGRLTGGAHGDIDNDGNMDIVFGSRGTGAVVRLEYNGGDITQPTSYDASVIDNGILANTAQIDLLNIANMDDDPELEVVYTGVPRGISADGTKNPIVILDYSQIPETVTPIADVRTDANGDNIPDNLGSSFNIIGTITSKSFSSTAYLATMQDNTAGITIYIKGDTQTDFEIGDRVLAKNCSVNQYRGLTEIAPESMTLLDSRLAPNPKVVTVEEWLNNAEALEGQLLQINGISKVSGNWPASGSSKNLTLTNGCTEFTYRVDGDTDVPDNAEPTWPINSIVVTGQYTSSKSVYNDGYQLWPRKYSDIIKQDVAVAPAACFSILAPADSTTIEITDSSAEYTITWNAAKDLNNDAVIYQWVILPDVAAFNASDTTVTVSATDLLDLMNGADTVTIKHSVLALDATGLKTLSMDEFTLTLIKNITVGVESDVIPAKFFVDQNYPNPFNPTTTIKFGLPSQSVVDLRIYDILGREVTTLVKNQALKAGTYSYNFDASNLASGTYIYRLTTGNNVVTKKMLLLK